MGEVVKLRTRMSWVSTNLGGLFGVRSVSPHQIRLGGLQGRDCEVSPPGGGSPPMTQASGGDGVLGSAVVTSNGLFC